MTSRLLTVNDVADRLQVARNTAYRYLEHGLMETVRLTPGGPLRVREEALQAFIDARITRPARRLRSTA